MTIISCSYCNCSPARLSRLSLSLPLSATVQPIYLNMTTAAPRDIPGASSSTTATTRSRANTFSYPRWDANGNSHHPPPDTAGPSRSGMSQSTRTSSTAMSSATASDATPALSASSSSSILRLLGLSPPVKAAALPSTSSSRDEERQPQTHHHRRGVSYGGLSSSSYTNSNSSPFYEDDEDGPPEAVTPPQSQLPVLTPVAVHDDKKHETRQQHKMTDYGHELDEAHKLELDDVFDNGSTVPIVKSPPPPSNAAIYGAPLGRRASWSPAVHGGTGNTTAGHVYSSSPPGGPPAGVLSWLHGQQTTYPISSGHAQSQNQTQPQQITSNATAATSAAGQSDYKDYGSSPVGLFRRLSLSINRRVSLF